MGEFQGFPRSLPAFWVALRLHNTVTDQPDMIEAYRRTSPAPDPAARGTWPAGGPPGPGPL